MHHCHLESLELGSGDAGGPEGVSSCRRSLHDLSVGAILHGASLQPASGQKRELEENGRSQVSACEQGACKRIGIGHRIASSST